MIRRTFLSSCAAAAAGAAFLGGRSVLAAPPADKPFSKVKLRMSAPIDFFPGKTNEEKLDVVAAWGLPAYEWLGAKKEGSEKLRAKADSLGLVLSCMVGTGTIGPGTMVKVEDHDAVVARADAERAVGVRERAEQHVAAARMRAVLVPGEPDLLGPRAQVGRAEVARAEVAAGAGPIVGAVGALPGGAVARG